MGHMGSGCGEAFRAARRAWQAWRAGVTRLLVRPARRVGPCVLLGVVLLAGFLAPLAQAGIGMGTAFAHPNPPRPGKNTFHPAQDLGKGKPHYLPGLTHIARQTPKATPIGHAQPITMRPADVALEPGKVAHLVSSDGRLEVTVPVGAVPQSMLTRVGGPVHLHVFEVAGPSGGTNSGQVSLGSYTFEVRGPHGEYVAGGLTQPVTVVLHVGSWHGAGFALANATFALSADAATGARLGVDGKPLAPFKPAGVRATFDAKHGTLSATFALGSSPTATNVKQPIGYSGTSGGSGSTGTWVTNSPQAQWNKPSDTSVDLNAGSLSYSYPLDLPAGPGGLTPQLQLSYSSGAVNENHNPQAAAGWVGEGWDLSLGSISWSELNVSSGCTLLTCTEQCLSNAQFSCSKWQNQWQFSDAFGNGGDLLPPNTGVSTWYDDTTNASPKQTGNATYLWHVTPDNQIKVISYTNLNTNTSDFPSVDYPVPPPCFRAWLPNGIMEEFGCTRDSLQYYVNEDTGSPPGQQPTNLAYQTNYVYRWDLDMIADASGNQIHITYHQDRGTANTQNKWPFPMDAVPATISYDSPGCHSTTTMCSGSNWQPQMEVIFDTGTSPATLYPSGQTACPTWTFAKYGNVTMRCDDAHDLGGGNPVTGLAAPSQQSILLLNDVRVQVTTTASNPSWQTLRTYQLSYKQTPSFTIYPDPNTGLNESVAGALLLTRIQEVGDDNTTTLPPLTMTYTAAPLDEFYLDTQFQPATTTPANCDTNNMAWNVSTYVGGGNACALWAQTYSSYYLAELDNGRGWSETYSWDTARNNTHGVPAGSILEDPRVCNPQMTTSPCKLADDENWSRVVLTQRQASVLCIAMPSTGPNCGSSGGTTLTSTWQYLYTLTDLTAYECTPGCTVGMYWGNMNDGDKLDFYNPQFMGFAAAQVTSPDGSTQVYKYYTTDGYGLRSLNYTPNSTPPYTCVAFYPNLCGLSPWTDPNNALHGRIKEEDDYQISSLGANTLLRQHLYSYNVTCPGHGVPASNPAAYFTGQLSAELDQLGNPVVDCEITPASEDVYQLEGGAQSTAPHLATTYGYTYSTGPTGHLTSASVTRTANDGTASGSPAATVQYTSYMWNDTVTATSTSASGIYLLDLPSAQYVSDGGNSVHLGCATIYDDGVTSSGASNSGLWRGLQTQLTRYTNCGTSGNGWAASGPVTTTRTYDANGRLLATSDGDANAGVSGHTNATGCTVGGAAYSACANYEGVYQTQVAAVSNALNQQTSLSYNGTGTLDSTNGWGQWLTGITDANSQATTFGYDALGRLASTRLPGEGSGLTTTDQYVNTCPSQVGAAEPCIGLATTQRLDNTTTVTSISWEDGWGRPFETVTPEQMTETGLDPIIWAVTYAVQYTLYTPQGEVSTKSQPYFVTLNFNSGPPAHPPYIEPNTSTSSGPAVTTYAYDGLGRVISTTNPLNFTTHTYYAQAQAQGNGLNDSTYYDRVETVDANNHAAATLSDALGRADYAQRYSGSGPYSIYATSQTEYDAAGNAVQVTGYSAGVTPASSVQTTASYDALGRRVGLSDADLGSGWTFAYDADGNLTQSVDPRGGASGTVDAGYDGLNRQLWRANNSGGTNPWVTYRYDSTANGNKGVGRLTGEQFNTGASVGAGSYAYTYDGRGQRTGATAVLGGTSYAFSFGYNDAGQPTTTTYSDGEVATLGYTAEGWLSSLTTQPSGQGVTTLLSSISENAAMRPVAATVNNGTYSFSASYDNVLHLTDSKLKRASDGATVFEQGRAYDAVGNVSYLWTNVNGATSDEGFCYDEQNRLTWAATSGTPPCNAAITSGTLSGGTYSNTYAYDALNRLLSVSGTTAQTLSYGPGMQAWPSPAPLHGVVSASSTSYAYDAAGDRTNAGSATNLLWDAERRLVGWTSGSGATTATAAYDGDGGV